VGTPKTKLYAAGPFEAVEVTRFAVRDTSTGALVSHNGNPEIFEASEDAEARAALLTRLNRPTSFLPAAPAKR
jgi:hypothetical protein